MGSLVQNNKSSKNIPQKYPLLMNSSEHNSYRSPFTHILLRGALSEPKRRGFRPECHPDELAPALYPYVHSFHACTYVPVSISTLGNQRRGFLLLTQYCLLRRHRILKSTTAALVTVALTIQQQASAVGKSRSRAIRRNALNTLFLRGIRAHSMT
jgi:hypothetical protein